MRNLKRALSLALAAVMVLGLMIVGAGAVGVDDFTDADEITNREAVSVLTSLGVITGKDDGSYDPSGTITRAEMTTIICHILNGGTDPQLGSSVTNTFSDTVSHWASGYIEFCVTRGIVAGRGDGTFDPDGTVTVAEGAKMMLVALGYNASVEGLTGSNWQINTDVLANQKGLYEGMEMANTSENLSRDNAAQMGYNLLDLNMISYDYIISTDGNVVSTTPQVNDDNDTVLEELFNAVRVEGVVTGNEMAVLTSSGSGSHLDAERTRINVTNYGDGDGEQTAFANGSLTLVATTGLEELGRSVNVFVRASSSSSRATIIGSVIVSEDNTVVTDYSGDTIAAVADDNNLNLVSGTQTALNYADVADYSASVEGNGVRGVEKILIDNDGDSDLDYVLLNTYRFGKVTSYVTSGDGSITVRCGSSNTWSADDADDVVGFEDVARDNYVIAAQIGGRLHVELAETVTGTLDGYRESTGSTSELSSDSYSNRLSVDGTNYNVAWLTGYTGGTDEIQAGYNYGSANLDTEATFYLGKGGYVIAVGNVSENAYNFALILAADQSGVSDQVRVALSDGTKGTYTVNTNGDTYSSSNTNTSTSDGHFAVGSLCSYTLSGSTIRLTEVDFATGFSGSNTTSFTKDRTSISNGTNTVYASASTAYFYVGLGSLPGASGTIANSDVNVYTGYSSAPSVDGAHSYVHLNSEGRAVAVIFVGDNITTANVDNFLYIYGRGNSNNDYTQVDAFVAGSADALEDLQATGDITAEGIRLYTIDADGYYELDTPDAYDSSAQTGNLITGTFTNGVSNWTVSNSNASTFVITNGTDSYELALTSDTLLVNDSSYLDDPTAELGAGPDEGDNIAYVLFSLDSGEPDEAKLVVIKNSTSDSTEEDTNNNGNTTFTGTNFATVDMTTGQVTVNYHGSLNAAALRSLILNADSSLTGVTVNGNNTTDWSLTLTDASGTVTIPHADIEFNEYFQVSYNGVSQGYYTTTDEDFDIEATSATASVLDGVSTDSTATTSAVSGAITVDVSALTADVDYWDAYTVTVSGTTTSLTADNTSFSTGDYVKVGAEVVATATDDNSGSLDTISVDNEDGDSVTADTAGGSFSLTFTMEDSNLTITVTNN